MFTVHIHIYTQIHCHGDWVVGIVCVLSHAETEAETETEIETETHADTDTDKYMCV